MVKDRQVSFLRLGEEVQGRFSKKSLWSEDPKKTKIAGS